MYGTPPSLSATVNAPPRSAGEPVSPFTARSPVKTISPAMTAALTASLCPLGYTHRSRSHTIRDPRRSSSAWYRTSAFARSEAWKRSPGRAGLLVSNTTYAPAARTRLYRRPSMRTLELMGLGLNASTPLRYLLAPPSSLQQQLYAFGAVRRLAWTRSQNSCRTLFPPQDPDFVG
jgi:hypothetical protein